MTFAASLRAERTARGLSKRALAMRAGLSPAYVTLLEQGRRAPTRMAVRALGAALDTVRSTSWRQGVVDQLLHAAGYALTPEPSPAANGDELATFAAVTALAAALTDEALAERVRAQLDRAVAAVIREMHERARQGLPLDHRAEDDGSLPSTSRPPHTGNEDAMRRVLEELRSPVYDL